MKSHNLEFFIFWQSLEEVPSSLLSQYFRLGVDDRFVADGELAGLVIFDCVCLVVDYLGHR